MANTGRFSLIPFAAQRRRARFERGVEAQLAPLTRLARGLVTNTGDAEDLVHDCCVKALAADPLPEFASDARLGAWLKRILVNTFRDQYRRRQRSPMLDTDYHAASGDSLNVYELVASTRQSPVECLHNRDSSSAIEAALSALPPEVRVVTVLALINELSYRDIAWVTDCPVGTVMSRLSRGRRQLRAALADFNPGNPDAETTTVAGSDSP